MVLIVLYYLTYAFVLNMFYVISCRSYVDKLFHIHDVTLNELFNKIQEFRTNESPFVKPSPRPRGVIRSHTVAAANNTPGIIASDESSRKNSPDAKPRKVGCKLC